MKNYEVGFFSVSHEDGSIERSMGRLIAFMAACTGIGTIAVGLVFKNAAIVGIGAGLFSSGELLKYGQKRVEK